MWRAYRCGMVVAGAFALYIAAGLGTTAEHYLYDAWRWTYLCMAATMLIGVATTLVIREPVRRRTSSYFHDATDYARFLLLFALVVGTFVAVLVTLWGYVDGTAAWLSSNVGLHAALARFLGQAMLFGAALGLALIVARLSIAGQLVRRELVQDTYIAPVADFFMRYGSRAALLILLLVGFLPRIGHRPRL